MYGSLNVTDGLTVDLRVQFATPDEATKFAALSKSQAQQASKMFDKVDITFTKGTPVPAIDVNGPDAQ